MIRPALRLLCAVASLALSGLATLGFDGWQLPAIAALLFAVAAIAGGRAPKTAEPERAMENFHRFRLASLLCFTTAVALLMVASLQSNHNSDFVQSAASLGAAFWLVAFGLLLFVVYFRTQVRAAE